MSTEPLHLPKSDYTDIINRISVQDSPVGIDAQYTHAVIIAYLQQLTSKVAQIESELIKNGLIKKE